jgi:hypothetical protein
LIVDSSGNVVVPQQFTGFASASGNKLTIQGYAITLDATALSHDLLPCNMSGFPESVLSRTSTHQLTLIPLSPAAGYAFFAGSGVVADFSFVVGTDGSLSYPADCSGFLSGQGTRKLNVGGYPILIDATAADSDLIGITTLGLPPQAPRYQFVVIVPGHNYGLQTTNGVLLHAFNVGRDGSITFDPAVAGSFVASTIGRLKICGKTPF